MPPEEDEPRSPESSALGYWHGRIDSELRALNTGLTSVRVDMGRLETRTEHMVEQQAATLQSAVEKKAGEIDAAVKGLETRLESVTWRIAVIVGGACVVGLLLQSLLGPLLVKLLTKGP